MNYSTTHLLRCQFAELPMSAGRVFSSSLENCHRMSVRPAVAMPRLSSFPGCRAFGRLGPFFTRPPGGESLAQVRERVHRNDRQRLRHRVTARHAESGEHEPGQPKGRPEPPMARQGTALAEWERMLSRLERC